MSRRRFDSGRLAAYLGMLVGLGVSVATNDMHAVAQRADGDFAATLAAHLPPGWAFVFRLSLAAFWPVCAFIALEVLIRKQWRSARSARVAFGGTALVALVAAVVSYTHLHDLLAQFGEPWWSAYAGPLSIDGLMAVSAAALLDGGGPPAGCPSEVETARSDDELLADVRDAIKRGDLPAAPSANALRALLGVGSSRAGRLAEAARGLPAGSPVRKSGTHG